MPDTSLQDFLLKLNKNFSILREREAKYATAAPLDLLNQLDDYTYAIHLAEKAIRQDIPLEQLQDEFNGLNLQLNKIVFIAHEPPRKPFTGRNPYRGLRKFTEDEAEFFFGRTDAVETLLGTVKRLVNTRTTFNTPDLITVLGPSGSGKSSLVRAGLIPALQNGQLPGSDQWLIRVMMPGHHPLSALAAQFVELTGRGLPALRQDLQSGEHALHELMLESLTLADLPEEAIFMLVVDQFEEVFTLSDPAERQAFLDQLLYTSWQDRCFVVLTMRADFYDKTANHKRLAEVITENQMLVSPMSEKELREVIMLPAEAVGLELEKALVETLLNDTADAPSVLPLLQQALTELFRYRDGNLLTLEAYQKIGGVQGALAHRADIVLDSMPMAKRHIARRVFMRLVQLGDGTADTRRRATFNEVLPQDSDISEVEAIVKTLADANLIVTDLNPETDEVILDVSHEALIKEWPRFQSWLDWDRRGLRIRQQLAQAVRDWDARGRDEDSLYRGSRLLEAEEWILANPGEINPTEADFIEASAAVRDRAEAERRRRTQLIIASLSIGLILMALGAIFGFAGQSRANSAAKTAAAERNQAEAARDEAEEAKARAQAGEQQALAQSLAARARPIYERTNDSELAALLAVEGEYLNEQGGGNAQTVIDTALREVLSAPYFKTILSGHQGGLFSAAFSPDSQTIAAAGDSGTISLWNVTNPTKRIELSGHPLGVRSVAFSPVLPPDVDRQVLASAGDDGAVRVWNISQPTSAPTLLHGSEEGLLSAAFSSDGQTLAAASADGLVHLWNTGALNPEPDTTVESGGGAIWSIAFSPDGRFLAAAGANGFVYLWNLNNLESQPSSLLADEIAAFAVSFSPDSQALASAGFDRTIKLWDMGDLSAEPLSLSGHENAVRSLAFSPDGQTLASGSFDQTVRLWSLRDPLAEPEILAGHEQNVWAVTFSADGQILASASADQSVRLWTKTDPAARPVLLSGHEASVTAVLFDPASSERRLISAGDDGAIRLWDATKKPATWSLLSTQEDRVSTIAFTNDGRYLASAGGGGAIRVWNMSDPDVEPAILTGHEDSILSVAFSPDNQILASAGAEATVRLWQVDDPDTAPVTLTGHEQTIRSVTFSPDGQILASGSFDGTIRLWSTTDFLAAPMVLQAHQDGVLSLTFSPDGRRLASSGNDNTIRLWDMADPAAEPITLPGHAGGVFALAFSPDGQTLASASFDETVRLWSTANLTAAPVILRGHQEGVLALVFSPDGELLASAGEDRTIILWVARLNRLAELACQQVRRNLTTLEWQQFLGAQHPYRRTCSNHPVHPSLVEAARELVKAGRVDEAINRFKILADLDNTLDLNPEAEVTRLLQVTIQELLRDGRVLARSGQIEQAVAKFRQALVLDPTLELDPVAEAGKLAEQNAENLVNIGLDKAKKGELEEALSKFRQVQALDTNFQIPAVAWHALCVSGNEQEQAQLTLEACNRAVEQEPKNGLFRNSRGVARILNGDQSGAAEDFKFFREWLEQN